MKALRAFYFRGINDKGNTFGEIRYYPYEPSISELADDLQTYVHEESTIYDQEHATKSKWYGGFDDLGWEENKDGVEDIRYGL